MHVILIQYQSNLSKSSTEIGFDTTIDCIPTSANFIDVNHRGEGIRRELWVIWKKTSACVMKVEQSED